MSDQDFFFEDDTKPAAKSDNKAKKAAPASGPANKGGSRPAATPPSSGGQSVTMTMAIMFAVIGLLLGVVIGLFIGNAVNPGTTATVAAPSTQAAPVLTNEQMNSGQLPAGHPSINSTATTAPSTTTTKTK